MISFKHIKLYLFLLLIPFKVLADNSVGTPQALVDVNNNGAATYNLSVEIPDGGGFHPQIGLAYNSQSAGYGNAGYGFNITGISVITSGGRNVYYDGQVKGAEYLSNSSFYLDGKRLLLESGTEGTKGAVYTIEGDPYTKVSVDGYWDNSSVSLRFEVVTQDGTTYRYGNNDSSRLSFYKNGKERCSAWFIDEAVDKYNNIIYYRYTKNGLSILPKEIVYGINSHSRGIECKINFDYSDITKNNQSEFYIGGYKGTISKKLSTITSSITNSGNTYTYRKYTLGYSDNIDSSSKKYTRLTSITESNASGETYAPVKIDWNGLQSMNISSVDKSMTTNFSDLLYNEKNRSFFALDINGDGVSDIIKLSFMEGIKYGAKDVARFYVYDSQVDKNGNVTFNTSAMSYYNLGNDISFGAYEIKNNGITSLDLDGDGFNDIVSQYYENDCDERYSVNFKVAFGRSIAKRGPTDTFIYSHPLQLKDSKSPLSVNMDIDGDGKQEIVFIENQGIRKNKYDRSKEYHGGIICVNKNREITRHDFYISFSLNDEPKKLFAGDFNNDGLQDIIVIFEDHYIIFFNNGFSSSYADVFNNRNVKRSDQDAGIDFGNYYKIYQGDFNGDGLVDFLGCMKDDGRLYLQFNNGDGTFRRCVTPDFGIYEQSGTSKDDNDFSVNIIDFDNDGRADVMLAKSMFVYHSGGWIGKSYYRYENGEGTTYMKWLRATGDNLEEIRSYSKKNREKDASSQNIFVGDFDGDGAIELANYGALLNSSSTTFNEDTIHFYKMGGTPISSGKVSAITDALGVKTSFTYSSTTNPSVCEKGTTHEYIVNSYAIPQSVVSQLSIIPKDIHICTVAKFKYEDMRIHSLRGMLGFKSFTKMNQNTGLIENTTIDWNANYYIPAKITNTTTYIDGGTSVETSVYSIAEIGNAKSGKIKKYFVFPSKSTVTDSYNNVTTTTTIYDYNAERCILKNQKVTDDNGKYYKSVNYEYDSKPIGKYGSMWLPKQVISEQKHADADDADDKNLCTKYTTYVYDDWGNPTKIVNNAKTVDSLVTFYTYNPYYGLKTSEKTIGRSVKTIVKKYDYDSSGRFITRQWTSPASSEFEYNYNIYGNLTREQDKTNPNNILLTIHKYNAWNEKIETILPDGENGVTYTRAWDTSVSPGCYSITETPVIAPSKKTIYDSLGREVYSSTTGLGGVSISKSISYDGRGYVSSIVNKTGKLVITETFTYDGRGRKTSDILSSGASTTYKYGNRSLVTTAKTNSGDRVTTTTYDAWGNVKSITDPMDNNVEYAYCSNGQPSSVTTIPNTGESTSVTFTYNASGYRIKMVDPDAGTTTSSYAADGTILSQTDARGVTTNFYYDNLGRICQKTYIDKSGKRKNQTYIYGTSGGAYNRITSQTFDGNTRYFTYNMYGDILTEKRYVNHATGKQGYKISYSYNKYRQKTSVTYPGNVVFNYIYDADNGYLKEIKLNSKTVYKLNNYDGLTLTTNTVAGDLSKTVDSYGFPSEYKLVKNSTVKDSQEFTFDKTTGNLTTRTWTHNGSSIVNEKFSYDKLDRLTTVYNNKIKSRTLSMVYADNGNILKKSNVGDYTYDSEDKPHAVIAIEKALINSNTVSTEFHLNGKINVISDENKGASMQYVYGPNDEKWMSTLCDPDQVTKNDIEHVYFGDYEKIIKDETVSEYYFLENGVIVIREKVGTAAPTTKVYQAVTDYLGSILAVYGENDNEVFRARYDAWGSQFVYTNQIDLHYGYTGHEMLPQFKLINMVGRLYDPALGRFLSCDNYVQSPDNSQNFNRYSYCFNNPLKYKDPDGQFAWILVGAAIGAACNITYQAIEGNLNSFGDVLVAGAIGAGAGAITAATYGTASGAIAGTFVGAATGVFSTAAQGVANNMYFGTPLPTFSQFVWSAAIGGVCGGVGGYFSAKAAGKNPLTGKANTVPAVQKTSEPLQGVSVIQEQEVALESQVTIKDPTLRQLSTNYPENYFDHYEAINCSREQWSAMSANAKGQLGEDVLYDMLQEQMPTTKIARQVYLRVDVGGEVIPVRADAMYVDKNGITHIVEAKSGYGPTCTTNQVKVYPKMSDACHGKGSVIVSPYGKSATQFYQGNIPNRVNNFVLDIHRMHLTIFK